MINTDTQTHTHTPIFKCSSFQAMRINFYLHIILRQTCIFKIQLVLVIKGIFFYYLMTMRKVIDQFVLAFLLVIKMDVGNRKKMNIMDLFHTFN